MLILHLFNIEQLVNLLAFILKRKKRMQNCHVDNTRRYYLHYFRLTDLMSACTKLEHTNTEDLVSNIRSPLWQKTASRIRLFAVSTLANQSNATHSLSARAVQPTTVSSITYFGGMIWRHQRLLTCRQAAVQTWNNDAELNFVFLW